MPRLEEEELTRIHVQLFTEDKLILDNLYGDNIGTSRAVRRIVRAFIEENKSEIAKGLTP
jgi:hypothetical protein